MKKNFGYLIIIIIGVVSIAGMMFRCESIDNNISKENNAIEIFA